jgi:hypothetical protein
MWFPSKTYHYLSCHFNLYLFRSDEAPAYTIHNIRYTLPPSNLTRVNYIFFYSDGLLIDHREYLINKAVKSIPGQRMLVVVVVLLKV